VGSAERKGVTRCHAANVPGKERAGSHAVGAAGREAPAANANRSPAFQTESLMQRRGGSPTMRRTTAAIKVLLISLALLIILSQSGAVYAGNNA
jgi:hypothetical protein